MTYSRNARRRAITAGTRLPKPVDATEFTRFWQETEPARARQRFEAAVARVSKAFDDKRASKNLPARPWRPWRKSVTR